MVNKTGKEKFYTADKYPLQSERSKTYLLTMLPVSKGDYIFNAEGDQEWQIQRNSETKFAIYGTYKIKDKTNKICIMYNDLLKKININ